MSDPSDPIEPTTPRPLTNEEIEQRLAELEASLATETPKAPTSVPSPKTDVTGDEPVTSTEALLASLQSSTSIGATEANGVNEADGASRRTAASSLPENSTKSGSSGSSATGRAASNVAEVVGTSQIVERAIGISRFARKYYQNVAADPGATVEAAIVVVVVAIATGLGGLGAGIGGFVAGILWAVIRWLLFTAAAWFLAREVFKTRPEGSVTSLARVVGYAQAPGIIAIVGFIPLLGWSLSLVGNIWLVLSVVMALRYVLKLDFKQSFITAIGAWLVAGALAALIAVVFGVDLSTVF